MRFLLFISLFCFTLFSAELTKDQLRLLQASGYTQEDVNKFLSSTSKEEVNQKKEQIIKNSIEIEPNKNEDLSTNSSTATDNKIPTIEQVQTKQEIKRYASLFFQNKNSIDPYSVPTPENYMLNYADKISVNIFGGQNQKFELPINKDGKITIPQVGGIKNHWSFFC